MNTLAIDQIKPYEKNAKKRVECCVCNIWFSGIRNRIDRICNDCRLKKIKDNYYLYREEKIRKVKEYRQKNSKIIAIKKRIKYSKNRENVIQKSKNYYELNKHRIILTSRIYRKNNVEKILIKNRNRKGKIRSLSLNSDVTNGFLKVILENSKNCPICRNKYFNKSDKHIDHIIPISVGGSHTRDNLRIICKRCNLTRPKDGRDL